MIVIEDLAGQQRGEWTIVAGTRMMSMPDPDYRSADDYELAIEILLTFGGSPSEAVEALLGPKQDAGDPPGPVGKSWRQRAAAHLAEKLDRYFRDRVPLRTEQLALAEIKRIALIVKDSSEALLSCAERMKSKGDRVGAADAFMAYQRFRDEARALLGGEA
jgi:hypothetical protein